MGKSLLLLLASAWILGGCSPKNVKEDFSFDPAQREGVVVVSVSQDDKSGTRGAKAMFYLDGDDGAFGKNYKVLGSVEEVVPGMIRKGSDFEECSGHLYVITLPEGTHRITSWQIFNGSGLRIFPREKPAPLNFEVKAGEVKYLGNLHANLATGKNLFGITITGSGYPEVRDERSRDMALFKEKYPKLADKVIMAVLQSGPWLVTGQAATKVDPAVPSPAAH